MSNSINNNNNNSNGLSQDEIRKIVINMVADIVKQKYDNMALYNEKTNKAISTIQNEKVSGKYHITPFDDTGSDKMNNIVKNLTVLLTAIVEGIGEATTQIKKASKQVNKSSSQSGGNDSSVDEPKKNEEEGLLEATINGASELGTVLVQKGVLVGSEAMTGIINFILKSTTGDALLGEGGKAGRENINQRILLLTAVLQQLANDPLARKAIQDLSKEVTQETLEIIDITKPDIDKIVAEILTLINDVAAKSAAGLTSTVINVAMSVLGEIPFIGGLIDLTISIGRGFNALMKVTNVFVTKSSNATVQMAELKNKISNRPGNNSVTKKRLVNTADNLKNIVMRGLKSSADTVKNIANSDAAKSAMASAKSGADFAKQKAQDVANSDAAKSAMASAKSGADFAKQKAQDVANSDAVQNAQANATDLANRASVQVKSGVESAKDMANKAQMANKVANIANKVNTVVGGGSSKNKTMNTRKLRSHIAKSNKRLRKTIKLFHTTLPRMKYRTYVNKK